MTLTRNVQIHHGRLIGQTDTRADYFVLDDSMNVVAIESSHEAAIAAARHDRQRLGC